MYYDSLLGLFFVLDLYKCQFEHISGHISRVLACSKQYPRNINYFYIPVHDTLISTLYKHKRHEGLSGHLNIIFLVHVLLKDHCWSNVTANWEGVLTFSSNDFDQHPRVIIVNNLHQSLNCGFKEEVFEDMHYVRTIDSVLYS